MHFRFVGICTIPHGGTFLGFFFKPGRKRKNTTEEIKERQKKVGNEAQEPEALVHMPIKKGNQHLEARTKGKSEPQ